MFHFAQHGIRVILLFVVTKIVEFLCANSQLTELKVYHSNMFGLLIFSFDGYIF